MEMVGENFCKNLPIFSNVKFIKFSDKFSVLKDHIMNKIMND